MIEVIAKVMESLCFKIDASDEEREQCVQKVRKRKMGYLFENMEHMSLKEERRKTEEQRQRAENDAKEYTLRHSPGTGCGQVSAGDLTAPDCPV